MVSTPPSRSAPGFRMAALGTVAVMCQALLLREAMTTLGGSEIAWGVLLFLWLAGAGAGARLGGTIGCGSVLDRWAPMAVAVGTLAGSALMRAAPWLLVDVGGEVAGGPEAVLLWIVAVIPPSMAVGFAFARFAGALGDASTSYALESAGAAIGGFVFTFLLAPLGSPVIAGAALGIAFLAGFLPESRVPAIAAFVLSCTIGFAAGPWVETATWAAGRRPQPLAHATETHHQRVEIGAGPGCAIYVNGRLAGTHPVDPYLVLPKSRLLPLLHPAPAHTAVIGGLTDGRLVGVLDSSVERLTVVEEDQRLVEALRSPQTHQVGALFDDPRVDLRFMDPLRALHGLKDLDLIILLDGPPATLRANRSRTREFFELCRSSLAPDGLLVVDGGARGNYLGGAAGRLLAIQFTTLSAVFEKLTAIAGDPVYFVAGNNNADLDLSPKRLEQRWSKRTQSGNDTLGVLLPTLLDPGRSLQLTSDLMASPVRSPNTISRPSAVLPAATFSEARGFHPLLQGMSLLTDDLRWVAAIPLVIAAVWILLTPFVGPPTRIRTAPATVLGFVSMSWWLLLMAAWQGSRGSVYSEVGLLTALFMTGLAAGAAATMKAPNAFVLPKLFVAGAFISAIIAAQVTQLWPEAVIPLLLLVSGTITGAAFPGVAAITGGRRNQRGIARAFAGDEFGAAAAALLVGVIGLPWLGTRLLAALSALYCLAVIPAVIRGNFSR